MKKNGRERVRQDREFMIRRTNSDLKDAEVYLFLINAAFIGTLFVLQVEALVLQPATRTPPNISRSKNCNTQRTENKTTDVMIHQQSRRLLKVDILMSETC